MPGADTGDAARFAAAIAAIDAANADDPNTLVVDGVARPKEQAHAELMTAWVQRLDPEATVAQRLAARAHHLRRWAVPRTDYPAGRAGYLRWRTDLRRRHATDVAALLAEVGYDEGTIADVVRIVGKEGLRPGAEVPHDVQVHEDALCLVFLVTQFHATLDQLGEDHLVEVLAKTARKMSPAGLAAVAELGLDDRALALIGRALA